MKIEFWWIGKTKDKYLVTGIDTYLGRMQHYHKISTRTINDIKKYSNPEDLKEKEGSKVIGQLSNSDYLILLDEKGKSYSSLRFSNLLQSIFLHSTFKRLVFLIGGAYGASDLLKKRANHTISMSDMTFSHQMVRLFLVEQVYRAFTILRNEKYHNN